MLMVSASSRRQKSQLPQAVQNPRAQPSVAWYRESVVCEVNATLEAGSWWK
jgi:hypothetical protein